MSENNERSRTARRESLKKPAKQTKTKKFLRSLTKGVVFTALTVTGIGAVSASAISVYGWNEYGETIRASVTDGYSIAKNIKETDFITKEPTKIYDHNGKMIKEFKAFQYSTPEYKKINPLFVEALTSAEDERFREHHGVDLYGTLRGLSMTLQGNGIQGGSTITQQLVRNVILGTNEQTIERKITEQVVSQELEKKMSKNEIIRHYLNNVYFGNGSYGIGPATKFYFSKDQSKASIEEVAMIVGITNNPSLFDPMKNPKTALEKRNRVLTKMYENKHITKEQYEQALKKPLKLKISKHNIDNSTNGYALSYALSNATEHLMEKSGFRFQYIFENDKEMKAYQKRYNDLYLATRQKILNGGYVIKTSIDTAKQKELENVITRKMYPYYFKDAKTKLYKTQTAITTIDNKTGEVIAIAGGRSEKGNVFNRAFQGIRQPGSTIKPIVAYTPAFERGYTPESRMADAPVQRGPKNYYGGYKGVVSLRYATEISINTIPYKLASEVNPSVMMEKLGKMKFGMVTPTDKNPIIAVGGFTRGVTTVEMASGYEAIVNGGLYTQPTNVREIKDIVTGELLYTNKREKRKVYTKEASYMMVDTLKGVMTKGTGTRAKPNNFKNVIGKTGSTNLDKDSWFVGATPYYTTAVWVGYDTPSSLPPSEQWIASGLFKSWNESLHRNKKDIPFEKPSTIHKNGGRWYNEMANRTSNRSQRKYNENYRVSMEETWQEQRLAKEDYRIIHGLSKEEEEKRERRVKDAIEDYQNFRFGDLDQYEEALALAKKPTEYLKDVKHKEAYDELKIIADDILTNVELKKQAILDEIQRVKEEKERIKREAEEAKRLEEERKKQAELDRIEAEKRAKEEEEQARIDAIEAEKARIEEEKRKEEELKKAEEEKKKAEEEQQAPPTDSSEEPTVPNEETTTPSTKPKPPVKKTTPSTQDKTNSQKD